MKKYTVQSGDTLFNIAAREYGDGDLYPVIARQNHLANPNLIFAGQKLLMPYVTFRHLWTTGDVGTDARQQITKQRYGNTGCDNPHCGHIQLMWEVASGVAQHEIERGAWVLFPDLINVGHYEVKQGDSFAGLSAKFYDTPSLGTVISGANHIDTQNPTPGTVLIIPGLNVRWRIGGHTLETICREKYVDSDDVPTWVGVVEAANYISRPDKLFPGQTLHFPS